MTAVAMVVLAAQAPAQMPRMLPRGREAVLLALQALGEPTLAESAPAGKVVRLVLVPPFPNWRLVVVRATTQSSGVEVITKTLTDWHTHGSSRSLPVRRLPVSAWVELEAALAKGLWGYYPQPFPDRSVADGWDWYLEATGPRGYIELVQHSPRTGAFREACHALIWLSGVDMTQDEYIQWFTPP
jgi:hypothetical protein